jgi:hypothetical protein
MRRGGCSEVGINLLKAVLVTRLHLEFDLWDEVFHKKTSNKTIRFTFAHRSTKWPRLFGFQFMQDFRLKVYSIDHLVRPT